MGIVRFALRFPHTFYVLAALIVFLGTAAIRTMPTDIFPQINIPVVTIIWQYTLDNAFLGLVAPLIEIFGHLDAQTFLEAGREDAERAVVLDQQSLLGELVHHDGQTGRDVPDANAAFVYITREGTMGLIETTDRVTRTADLTGLPAGQPPSGVGFKVGVRFNLKWIVP